MSAHTPGPWKLELESDPQSNKGLPALRGFVVSAPLANLQPVICEIFPRPYPVAISEANARLIAAAPRLLAACGLAEEWLDIEKRATSRGQEVDPGLLLVLGALRSAIADASRGGA